MDKREKIACVTGASGIVGRAIVRCLLRDGYNVRVLTRRKRQDDPNVIYFRGSLENETILRSFLVDADLLFHCAGELNDTSRMWEVNVKGTERLLNAVKKSTVYFLCHLSSAGVTGRTSQKWVNEESICSPQNTYENSKWVAEQLVARGIDGCRTVILRPTNVIDETRPGALSLPMNGSWKNWLKMVIKGGECAHIIHAEDVAAAAMHFVSHRFNTPRLFIVSCDHEPLNTFSGLWALYQAVETNRSVDNVQPIPHLPLIVPYIFRRCWRGGGNPGDVRYSSEKLISEGFKFPLGVQGAVGKIISDIGSNKV